MPNWRFRISRSSKAEDTQAAATRYEMITESLSRFLFCCTACRHFKGHARRNRTQQLLWHGLSASVRDRYEHVCQVASVRAHAPGINLLTSGSKVPIRWSKRRREWE